MIAGCAAPIGVEKISPKKAQREFSHSVLSTGKISADAWILLRRLNRDEEWKKEPSEVLAYLHAMLLRPVTPFTRDLRASFLDDLAELNFAHAMETKDQRYFLAAALYAWLHLFPAEGEPQPTPLERGIRLSADIYNRGLTLALTDPETGDVQLQDGEYALPFGTLEIDFDETSLRWGERKFSRFASLADLEVRGLNNRYRMAGLGAPLAAHVAATEDDDTDLVFSAVRAPVTAVLRFEEPGANLTQGRFTASLSAIAYSATDSTEIAGETIPLESEPSAALALQLTEAPPWQREIKGFFQGDLALGSLGIVSLSPYQPGRIPVVLVHGTASSAGRWADLLNDLRSDSVLRRHYQFWLFSYNTGNPIAYSGWLLRKAIADLAGDLDPRGEDPALQNLVVMGHSQGGLLTKLLVVDSGERFWDLAIDQPPDEIELEPENRELLEGSLLVEPSPFVKRVIFLSTPHRGSRLANFGLAQLLGRLVRTPANIVSATQDVFRDDPETEVQNRLQRGAGSIGNMSPGNAFIQELALLPIAPGVNAHSIMGVRKGPKEDGSDGVVAYQSAHLDDVESELVVQSGHSSQSNPLVIREVHKILIEHLDEAIEEGVVKAVGLAIEEPIEESVSKPMEEPIEERLERSAQE
jgi:pimeloyl-ACP methyl ester carboxylesterase